MKSYANSRPPGKLNWCVGNRFRTAKGNYTIDEVWWSGGKKSSYRIRHSSGTFKVIPAEILDNSLNFENYLGL